MDFENISQYCLLFVPSLGVPYLVVMCSILFIRHSIQVYLKVRSSYTDIKLETRKEPPINIYLLDGLFVVVLGFLVLFFMNIAIDYFLVRGTVMELSAEVALLKHQVAYLKEAYLAEQFKNMK